MDKRCRSRMKQRTQAMVSDHAEEDCVLVSVDRGHQNCCKLSTHTLPVSLCYRVTVCDTAFSHAPGASLTAVLHIIIHIKLETIM